MEMNVVFLGIVLIVILGAMMRQQALMLDSTAHEDAGASHEMGH